MERWVPGAKAVGSVVETVVMEVAAVVEVQRVVSYGRRRWACYL